VGEGQRQKVGLQSCWRCFRGEQGVKETITARFAHLSTSKRVGLPSAVLLLDTAGIIYSAWHALLPARGLAPQSCPSDSHPLPRSHLGTLSDQSAPAPDIIATAAALGWYN
jgi:hypothetical protein